MFKRAHEDLSVADLAGARGSKNSFNHGVNRVVGDGDVDADFGKEVDDIFRAAVELRMPFLTTETFDFGNSKAVHARFGKCFTNIVELERLKKELKKANDDKEFFEKKLNNQGFVAKAPAAVVEQQRESLKKVLEKIAMLEGSIAEIEKTV